jgi:uncharacterized membrane protein YhaH (DUF805 family)
LEELFQFMFGASGRINRAKYWRSFLIYVGAGMMTLVILFTAAQIAAPVFIGTVLLVLIPWLIWGLSFTTERLHDRDKSAWWLVVFYVLPGVLTQLGELAPSSNVAGTLLEKILALLAFVLAIWGFIEIGFLRGTAGENAYGPDPLGQAAQRS